MLLIAGKIWKVDKIIKEISLINAVKPEDKDEYKIQLKRQKLHLKISEILFEAVKKREYEIIDMILRSDFVRADMVYNEKHLNIVQYSLVEDDNELFKLLLNKYYKDIKCYFENIPSFFILIMNKRNFELMELFLTNEKLYKELEKENICVCFYLAIQENLDLLIQIILNNEFLESNLDGKDIHSVLIYCISHNQYDKMKKILNCDLLISKFDDKHKQNIIVLALLNKDIKALEIIMNNNKFASFVAKNKQISNNVAMFAYSNNNIGILSIILCNKKKDESLIPDEQDDRFN